MSTRWFRALAGLLGAGLMGVSTGCESSGGGGGGTASSSVSASMYYGTAFYDPWYYGGYYPYPPDVIVTPPPIGERPPVEGGPRPEQPIARPPDSGVAQPKAVTSDRTPVAARPAPAPRPAPSIPSMPRPMPRGGMRR